MGLTFRSAHLSQLVRKWAEEWVGSCHSECRVFILWKIRKSQRRIREKKRKQGRRSTRSLFCFLLCRWGSRRPAGGISRWTCPTCRRWSCSSASQSFSITNTDIFFLFFPSNVSIYQCVFKAVFVCVQTTASYKSAQSDLWPLTSQGIFLLSLHQIYTPQCIDFLPCDWLIFVLTSSCTFHPIKWPVCIVKVWAFPPRVLSLRRASREGNGPTIFDKESEISVFSVLGLLLRCLRRNISTSGSLFPFSLQLDGHDRI